MSRLNIAEVEQTKLLANALDRTSTACITVGVITPLAGYIYGVSGFNTISAEAAATYLTCWFSFGAVLHYLARRTLKALV